VSHLDHLHEMGETLDTCYERPEKYMEEALRPIVDFRRYKITDCAAVREFYSLLRAAIKGARGIGRLGLLINDQTIPKIMSKMPYTDWKEWATKRPDWMQQDLATTFEGFIEKKWQDALNVAAAELAPWGMGKEKPLPDGGTQDRATTAGRETLKITGAVNVVEQETSPRPQSPPWDVSFGRKCRARNLIECKGEHVLLQCTKLLNMELNERKEILEKSGLCLFCLKHAADLECYGRGGKPRCTQDGCDGEHTPSVHKLVSEGSASVNFVAEDESESEGEDEGRDEDEEWWVGTIGMSEIQESGEGDSEEMKGSVSEGEARPTANLGRATEHSVGNFPTGESEEDGWWSPREPRLAPKLASDKPKTGRRSPPRAVKRRRLRKKEEETRDQEWERARQDAWLREMLSETSSSEDEGGSERFAESRKWMSDLVGIS
jgi:hypothetical protein